jgi:hypothetical protein
MPPQHNAVHAAKLDCHQCYPAPAKRQPVASIAANDASLIVDETAPNPLSSRYAAKVPVRPETKRQNTATLQADKIATPGHAEGAGWIVLHLWCRHA